MKILVLLSYLRNIFSFALRKIKTARFPWCAKMKNNILRYQFKYVKILVQLLFNNWILNFFSDLLCLGTEHVSQRRKMKYLPSIWDHVWLYRESMQSKSLFWVKKLKSLIVSTWWGFAQVDGSFCQTSVYNNKTPMEYTLAISVTF